MIPLNEIRNLSIGQFQMWKGPWALSLFRMWTGPEARKYERLNFLSVTFGAGDRQRTVHLTPVPPAGAPVSLINAQVADWFDAIRKAVVAVVGVAPRVSEPGAVTIASQRLWNPKLILVFAPLFAWLAVIKNIWPAEGTASTSAWAAAFALTLLLCLAVAWFFRGFVKAHQALMSGNLDAVTGNEDPAAGADASVVPRAEAAPGKPRRPFWWTVSAWVFVAIGLIAVVDLLTSLYSRPMNPNFSPALAHLFAGIALLTLSRRWRVVAVIALFLALLAGAFILVMMAVNPGHGLITIAALNLSVSATEQPRLMATCAVFLMLAIGWPCYLLMSAKAKALFGLPKPK